MLLEAAPEQPRFGAELARAPGSLSPDLAKTRDLDESGTRIALESCFERKFPPPERFLRWLVEDSRRMTWPIARRTPQPVETRFGDETQAWRETLFGRRGQAAAVEARDEAIRMITNLGTLGAVRKWWCFEGETSVDCCIETDSMLLFIEGKRTEQLSQSTSWYPKRCQLWRNLEVLAAASRGKRYALLLMAERHEPIPPIEDSCPHLSREERAELRAHYLGCITWPDACRLTQAIAYDRLPRTVEEAESH